MSNAGTDAGDTRQRIARAALGAFADHGFDGASTREIARRAGVNQGLITYYFRSKDALWKETVAVLFADVDAMLLELTEDIPTAQGVSAIVSFFANRPEFVRFMIGLGRDSEERMAWLVDHHLRRVYERLPFLSDDPERRAHEFYMLTGAAALIFATPEECVRLTGIDPGSESAIRRHAELLAGLFGGTLAQENG